MSNKCGRCQVCCTTLQIQELDKPDFKRCPNQYSGGCQIYSKRPQSCRDYKCSWLRDHGAPQDRPDKVGILISEQYSERYGAWATIHVLKPKARKLKRVKKKILELVKRIVLIEMTKDGMILLGGPSARAKEFVALIRKEGGHIITNGEAVPAGSLINYSPKSNLIPASRLTYMAKKT